MSKVYLPPPTLSEIAYEIGKWLSRLYRVKVTIILDKLDGRFKETIEIAHPDKEE